jgi:Gamma-glutamyl cyclotransferase, AIG2-like
MRLYFAFGANMDVEGMSLRCPQAEPLGRAELVHHRFAIVHPGYATVIPATGSRVHGVLWKLGARDLAVLDAYENLPLGLYGREERPVRHEGRIRRAITYFVLNPRPARVRPGYLEECVLPAARHWRLPEAYIRNIEGFVAPAGAREPWRETKPV